MTETLLYGCKMNKGLAGGTNKHIGLHGSYLLWDVYTITIIKQQQ